MPAESENTETSTPNWHLRVLGGVSMVASSYLLVKRVSTGSGTAAYLQCVTGVLIGLSFCFLGFERKRAGMVIGFMGLVALAVVGYAKWWKGEETLPGAIVPSVLALGLPVLLLWMLKRSNAARRNRER